MKSKYLIAVVFCSLVAFAEQELDLSFLKGLEAKAKESTDINLGPEQIQLLMGFSGEGSKELLGLGKSIERVQVKTFEFDKEGMYNIADAESLRAKLKSADFVPLISVKEKGGFTEIVMRKGPKGMRGFVIVAAEARELTVVNIVGDLDLASLGKLTGKFGIPNIQMNSGAGTKGSKGSKGGKEEQEEDEK
jgi:hypothetical protein